MVDHISYTGAVRKMKSLTASGELGELSYYDSVRINLGFSKEINVSTRAGCMIWQFSTI